MKASIHISTIDTRYAQAEVYCQSTEGNHFDRVAAQRTFCGEYAEMDARAWAEAQVPRVEAAWAALKGERSGD